jgi:hypothetical protein
MEYQIDREVTARFPDGAVQRVALLGRGDDPAIEPEELLVRVFIKAAGGPQDSQRSPRPTTSRTARRCGTC